DRRGQHRARFLWRNALVVATLLERICDASRRLKPEVCLNEQVLKLLQRAGVELALGKDACNAFGKFAGCLSKPHLEALEPARLWLRLLFRLSCFWFCYDSRSPIRSSLPLRLGLRLHARLDWYSPSRGLGSINRLLVGPQLLVRRRWNSHLFLPGIGLLLGRLFAAAEQAIKEPPFSWFDAHATTSPASRWPSCPSTRARTMVPTGASAES